MIYPDQTTPSFSIWRTLRLSSFHIGSAMGDILVTSIWNRVMISNFGLPAAPVSLLIALRYLLSPLSLWAGFLSDTKTLWGRRRTSYIWLGRGMMVLSLPFLGFSLGRLESVPTDVLGWVYALTSSLLYGIGTLISGSPFLALVRDSAPPARQGLAISIVETVLIIFFAVAGITFSLWLPAYDERIFWQMALATMAIGGFFWFFAIAGAEKRSQPAGHTPGRPAAPSEPPTSRRAAFAATFRQIWSDARTRRFFFFLSLATMAAWAQDAVLEPFGADVFDLPFGATTRFNSYWQTATVVTLVTGAYVWRTRPPERQSRIANGGLITMALGMVLLGGAAFTGQAHLIEAALLIFGGGFGVYTFGGLSLMAVMSSDQDAGAYLGLWSMSILVFKGLGTFLGGALRDLLLLQAGLPAATTYGAIFILAAAGLLGAAFILARLDVLSFARDVGRTLSRTEAQIASAD
jgi:BCD family chlorophyll transporter-like MFS transporter